jgi:hypothetical protein
MPSGRYPWDKVKGFPPWFALDPAGTVRWTRHQLDWSVEFMTAIRGTLALTAVIALAAPASAAFALPQLGTGPVVTTAPIPATSQGIIMRDGGVCDPIRHMGC